MRKRVLFFCFVFVGVSVGKAISNRGYDTKKYHKTVPLANYLQLKEWHAGFWDSPNSTFFRTKIKEDSSVLNMENCYISKKHNRMLKGKRVILGVCGSIAAYKSALLCRLLVKSGAEVKVVMTEPATEFIGKLTLSTLSKNPVITAFNKNETGEWNNHVDLGIWADIMIVAPMTANTLSKFANGSCDNFLSAVYLSARCPVFFAPAMDLDMYQHPSTLRNLKTLASDGVKIINPEHGELASGLIGEGRMAEPEQIIDSLEKYFLLSEKLSGKRVLITAGPTYEAIDPVRFIGNHSSGKMGFAIAEQMLNEGAHVTLVSGPTHCTLGHRNLDLISVNSAKEMLEASEKVFSQVDIAVMSAAVADYTPREVAKNKIKKKDELFDISCVKTVDIALTLGKKKRSNQFLVGFALETENEKENALSKMQRKNFDMIVLNSLNDKGAGFGYDTNKAKFFFRNGQVKSFELKSKKELARDVVDHIDI